MSGEGPAEPRHPAAGNAAGDPALVRGLQERAARAQPVEHLERIGDWWLRYTGGPAWWSGTVLAHGSVAPAELPERIAAAERFYDRFGAAPGFQVTPGVCDPGLDAALAERGYAAGAARALMTVPAAAVAIGATGGARIDDAPSRSWLDAYRAVRGGGSAAMPPLPDGVSAAYASVADGDEIVGVGRVVLDDGWAGVFGMATLPSARGRGVGRSVLGALARWAIEQGASGIYLQVESENAVAWRLYERAGFAVNALYHYRTRDRMVP